MDLEREHFFRGHPVAVVVGESRGEKLKGFGGNGGVFKHSFDMVFV